MSGAPGREPHQVAVAALQRVDAELARQRRVLGEMQRFAVHRDDGRGLDPADHLLELGAARMAGHVHQMGAVGDDLDALVDQAVDDAADRLLVARNGARREDHPVAARQRHLGMLVGGDARERRARLALAAGAERHDLVGRQMAVDVHAAEIGCTPSR